MTKTLTRIEALYERRIKSLTPEDQLLLLKLIVSGLAEGAVEPKKKHSVLEFAGAGAHNPIGMDAQEYVDKLREEWDHRP